MNYGEHNFIEITQQTKLQVALVVSSQSRSTCRARRVERVELCCLTMSTQPKCNGIWALQSISFVMFNGRKHIFRPIVIVTLI